ncbi:MAG: hypothetical protein RBT71_06760 [Flavobacteriales bacterium]|nr:hypothetical protein [Flavobacteriales bacterium]
MAGIGGLDATVLHYIWPLIVLPLRSIAGWWLWLPLLLTVLSPGLLHDRSHGGHAAEACAGHGDDGDHADVRADCALCDMHLPVAVPGMVRVEPVGTVLMARAALPSVGWPVPLPCRGPHDRGPPGAA